MKDGLGKGGREPRADGSFASQKACGEADHGDAGEKRTYADGGWF